MTQVFTLTELQRRSDSELHVLFRMVSAAVADSPRGSREQRSRIASLENIRRTMHLRRTRQVMVMAPGC